MKLLVISPELIIPWEHKSCDNNLVYKAIDEKYMKRPLDEMVANAAAAFSELQAIGLSEYRKKYNENYNGKHDNDGWKHVPPAPVVEAPDDLLYLGFFVVYNGHNRLEAARRADIPLPVLILENDEDMKVIFHSRDDFLSNLDFASNRDYVWEMARWRIGKGPKRLEFFQ